MKMLGVTPVQTGDEGGGGSSGGTTPPGTNTGTEDNNNIVRQGVYDPTTGPQGQSLQTVGPFTQIDWGTILLWGGIAFIVFNVLSKKR